MQEVCSLIVVNSVVQCVLVTVGFICNMCSQNASDFSTCEIFHINGMQSSLDFMYIYLTEEPCYKSFADGVCTLHDLRGHPGQARSSYRACTGVCSIICVNI